MPTYQNILVADPCFLEFEKETGVFITDGQPQLVGDAVLELRRRALYATITTTTDITEFFPSVQATGNVIDVLTLSRKSNGTMKRIKEQLAEE